MDVRHRRTEKWLSRQTGRVRLPLTASITLGILSGLLILVQTALLVDIVNGLVFEHLALRDMLTPLILLPALFLARAATQYASRRAGFECASAVRIRVRDLLTSRLTAVGPVGLGEEHRGEIASTVVDGVEALEGYFARYLPQRAVSSILPLLILAVAYPLDWVSGLIFTGTALFIPILMTLIGMEARARNQAQWRELSKLSARFLDALSGLAVLKAFGAAQREAAAIARISEEHRRATLGVVKIAFVSSLMLELITTVSIALVAITAGFRLLDAQMDFHHAYFILLIAPEFYAPLRTMGQHYHARMSATAAAERIVELLGTAAEATGIETERPAPGHEGDRSGEAAAGRSGHRSGSRAGIGVEIDGLAYTYPGGRDGSPKRALSRIDLGIEPGEHLAIFGPSGAGKSTLLSLLLGFVKAAEGSIRVGGLDPADPTGRAEILKNVAWMPQRPTIFYGSVLDNILLARRGADVAQVREAARRARADEFIDQLPDDYGTLLGERGENLSGGQIQRIALARMFLRDAPLLLLDEPGAHLDADNEALVYDRIAELAQGRTLIIVTHRPSAARLVDRIAVLDEGRIVETGSPSVLARADGAYSRMLASFEVAL